MSSYILTLYRFVTVAACLALVVHAITQGIPPLAAYALFFAGILFYSVVLHVRRDSYRTKYKLLCKVFNRDTLILDTMAAVIVEHNLADEVERRIRARNDVDVDIEEWMEHDPIAARVLQRDDDDTYDR